MAINQRRLRELIQEQELTITDEELFISHAFQRYQTSLAKAATGRYRYGLQVLMDWDISAEADIAHTDNSTIYNNAGNFLTQSLPSRYLRSQSITGLTGHEIGHLLFTDFTSRGLYLESLCNGIFYPAVPEFTNVPYKHHLAEIIKSLEDKDKATCLTLTQCANPIHNILEDTYIEACICEAFPGIFRQGIELNNYSFSEQIPSIQSQIDNQYEDFSIVVNLIIAYCRAGTINNITNYNGPYLDYLDDCIPFIEDSIYSHDIKDRFHATNCILILLWPYIKPLVERMKEQLEKQPDESSTVSALSDSLTGQIKSGPPLPSGTNGNEPQNAKTNKEMPKPELSNRNSQTRQDIMDNAENTIKEEYHRTELIKTTTIKEGSNPGVTYNHQYTGSGNTDTADDFFRILHDVTEEKAKVQYQQQLTEELQKAATEISYGNAHTGIHITIHRLPTVNDSLIDLYHSIAPPLLRISKRLQRSIAPLLKEDAEGGKQRNLLLGKRLDTHALYRTDGAIFSRNRLPSEQRLAVAVLVDESGSMYSDDRILYAKYAAVVLYDFCRSLGIPITIYGHTTSDMDVDLYSYVEFDSIDDKDCYRLMDIKPRHSNRDGAALRYVAEHLAERTETHKLLIIISDGNPRAVGYSDTAAEADLRGIKKEYQKRGIVMFAAAIGDDREYIERIYKDGFLDITNLDNLPKNMALLVKQHLQD